MWLVQHKDLIFLKNRLNFILFKKLIYLIGGELLYNIVVVFAMDVHVSHHPEALSQELNFN